MSSTGFYLGTDFVDLVVLESSKDAFKIIQSFRNVISEEPASAEKKDKLSQLSEAAKKTFSAPGLKQKAVNFCLPQEEIIIRRFRMPYLPIEERLNAIKFEAQRYLPFKIDDTLPDFYVVSESKTEKYMDAFFAAVNKQAAQRYAAFFAELKVKPLIADIMPIALLRVISTCKNIPKEESKAVVYVEKNTRGTIVIVKDGQPYLARETGLSISKESFFQNIVNNTRVSIDYFKRETKEVGVGMIILCGDADLMELETYLKENFPDTKIEQLRMEESSIVGLNDLSKKQLIAIGLAMASFEKPKPRINLLTGFPQVASLKQGVEEYKPLIIEGAAILVVLILLQVLMGMGLAKAKGEAAKIKSQKPMLVGIDTGAGVDALTGQEAALKARLSFLKGLVGEERLLLTKKLSVLGSLLPENAWIESFQFSDEIDKSRFLKLEGLIYSKEKDETAIANKILVGMKGAQNYSYGFEDIKFAGLRRESAYDKEVVKFSIDSTGQPLKSQGMLGS